MLIAISAILLAAAPADPNKPARLDNPELNCYRGFDKLVADLDKKPGLTQVPADAPQTDRFQSPTEQALYTVTTKDNPAHPAIVRQQAVSTPGGGVSVQMLACGYSRREVLQKFMNTFPARNTALKAQLERGEAPFGVQAEGVPNPGQ